MTRIAVTTLYALSLLLPLTGLLLAYARSRRTLATFEESDRMEVIIDAKYAQKAAEIEAKMDALFLLPHSQAVMDQRALLNEENNVLSMQKAADYKEHAVDALTYARFNGLIQPAVRDRPKDRFHLAKQEILFVGTGIVLGTAASIWGVWI